MKKVIELMRLKEFILLFKEYIRKKRNKDDDMFDNNPFVIL